MKHVPTLSLAAALFAAMTLSAKANLVANGGFEAGAPDPVYGYPVPVGWTTTLSDSPSLWVAGPGDPNLGLAVTPEQGNEYLAFGAGGPDPDTIMQSLATTLGAQYTVSFYVDTELNPDYGFDLTASWDNTPFFEVDGPIPTSTVGWIEFSYTLRGTGSDTLSFAGWDAVNYVLLDDVAVVAVPTAAAPDAASVLSYIAAAAAIAGLALTGRRARKTA